MASSVNRTTGPAYGADFDNQSNKNVATVQLGETDLSQVAERLGVDFNHLLLANPQIQDPSGLMVGQDIHLPQPQVLQMPSRDFGADSVSTAHSGLPPAPLTDPLNKSALQAIISATPQLPLDEGAIKNVFAEAERNVMHADSGGSGSGTATKTAGPKVPADVTAMLTHPLKNSVAKDDLAAAQKAITTGDYTAAFKKLDTLIKTNDENLWEEERPPIHTVRDQLEFLSKMQEANIKADYPPTQAQLVDYFKTLKDQPAAARQAFEDYTHRFHVHPVNIKGEDFDIAYSHEKTKYGKGEYTTTAPRSWSDVANRPVSSEKFPQYIGKQMNDCEGFGFMAAELLGAAGFKVAHHVSVYPGVHGNSHEMVMFTHQGESGYTVTSNDGTFHGNNAKAVAKQGYEYAAGKDKVTGKEHFYTGKTMADAEVQAAVKDNEL